MPLLQASPFPKVPPEKGLLKAGRKWEPDLPSSTVLQEEALQVIGGRGAGQNDGCSLWSKPIHSKLFFIASVIMQLDGF